MYIYCISSDETERNMLDFVFGCGCYGDGWKQKNVWVQTVHIQEKKRCTYSQSSTNLHDIEAKTSTVKCTTAMHIHVYKKKLRHIDFTFTG